MTKGLSVFDDWATLDTTEWDNLVQFQYLDDAEIDRIIDDLFSAHVDPEFKAFIDSLAPEDAKEFTPEEIQQMLEEKTPTEFKLVLDKLDNFDDIVRIFRHMTGKQVYAYFTGLSDAAWKQTTPEEWQSYVVFLDSRGFKGILDYMSAEEILYVWQFFDDWMTQKFFDGLDMADIYGFTPAEWNACYWGFSASEFKQIFFDRMDTKGIMYVSEVIGDMDDFLEGLTIEDWKNLTPAEWDAFLSSTDSEDLIGFVHEMHAIDRRVVYDMFRFMPKQMIKEMREAPRLGLEFSEDELETIRKGMDQNEWKKARKDKSDFTKPEPEKEPKKPKDQPKKKPGKDKKGPKKDPW